jgi:tetratricopeptide (TPR) repeat protein
MERELLLGGINDEMGDYKKALACYRSALDMVQVKTDRPKMNSVLERQANCYRNLCEMKRAIEIYSTLFTEQDQPVDLRVRFGLGLAGSLTENKQYPEARLVLDEVAILLGDYDGMDTFSVNFAQLWKYRAVAARAIGRNQEALDCAGKSLDYWIKVADSSIEEKRMRDLIHVIERIIAQLS